MKKVLAFGYVPIDKGGKQDTGLATGIFDLHDFVNQQNSEFEVILAATDVKKKQVKINNTIVLGWTELLLLLHILKNPLKVISLLYFAWKNRKYKLVISPTKLFFKSVFLDYCIQKTSPKIIHFHASSGALLSESVKNDSVKKMLRIHGINGYDKSIANFSLHRKLEKFVSSLNFSCITFVTESIKQEWIDKYGSKVRFLKTILNGYNSNLFYPKRKNDDFKDYDLVTFSGISDRKGQIRVIQSITDLKRQGLDLSYLVIGRGDNNYTNKLKEMTKLNNLKVYFKDYIPQTEILKYLHKSKYFILPSTTEGFGKVFIESIAAGVPVVLPMNLPITKQKGILSENNSVFSRSSSSQDITFTLKQIFKKNKDVNSIEVSQSVLHLEWSIIAKKYISIYKNIQ